MMENDDENENGITLPRIEYRVFSTIDLRSAYHQVSINKPYTAGDAPLLM